MCLGKPEVGFAAGVDTVAALCRWSTCWSQDKLLCTEPFPMPTRRVETFHHDEADNQPRGWQHTSFAGDEGGKGHGAGDRTSSGGFINNAILMSLVQELLARPH